MRYALRCFRPVVAALLFCCASIGSTLAVEKNSSYQAAFESIRADDLTRQVGILADPAMEGREAGSPGGRAAGDYLVKQYARLHLHGAGDDGGFFQSFDPNYRNILAILPGSDAKLRDQVIVVGAHYDHIGYGGRLSLGTPGYIHPGADDNASGSSAVLELAKAFVMLTPAPKRSILFVAWDAEEQGLLGSKHWTAHPTIPLDHVAAMVNLDMVGRLREGHLILLCARSGYGWRRLACLQNQSLGLRLDFPWAIKPNADFYPFFEHDIPVLMFHTGLHDDYHRPSDVARLINGDGMMQVTRLLFGVVYELAQRPAAIAFREASRQETDDMADALVDQAAQPSDRLGVEWTENAARTGGVRVSSVGPGSPAERAGLREGDCIESLAGREIRGDDDFFAAVSSADSPASLRVKRPGEEKKLDVKVALLGSPLRWGIVWNTDDAEPGAVILTHVVPGSPAALAGLRTGDRVYQAAGRDFADESAFAQLVKTHAESLQLLTERDGRLRIVVLRLHKIEPAKRAA
jgi:hypothetical protein